MAAGARVSRGLGESTMSGWLTHAVAFLLGAGVGAVLYAWYAGRTSGASDPRRLLRRLYKESPRFFDEIRLELGRPEFKHVREFAILESSRMTFVSEDLRFVYYEEDIPDLHRIVAALEDGGYVDDVTKGKTPIFRLKENFVAALESL